LRIIITKDYNELSKTTASLLAKEIRTKPRAVIGLATGSTPLGTYQELVRLHKEEGLDFSGIRTFNLDEYFRLPPEHPESYHAFMAKNLFNHVNVKPENVSIPDGMAPDVQKFCSDYELRIKEAGGIDIQLLGIGRDGHIGFNEPGSSLGSRTRLKTLTEETVRDNTRFFGGEENVPRLAITMGVGTILDARKLLMLASGAEKADAVKQAIEGPVSSQVTASVLQLHPNVTVVVDGDAGKRLKRKEYYLYVERMAKRVEHEIGI
jgi:glucosamine-6-phosphate deaminase